MNAEQSKTHGEKERNAGLLDKAKQTEQRPRTDEESIKKYRQKTARGEKQTEQRPRTDEERKKAPSENWTRRKAKKTQ